MFETGVGLKNPLFFIGCVEKIDESRHEGRVKVRAFNVHGNKDEIPTEYLPWATVVYGNYDPNIRLALNDWVFGVFIDGREAQSPMVLGLIPTQMTSAPDPGKEGFGAIPSNNCDVQLGDNAAQYAGDPRQSRLYRAEDINDTYVPQMEMFRQENITPARGGETWSEPPPAYNATYPYNRVIKTSKHSIEIDDTPGAERICIYHNSGSYIQIDDIGTHTHKAAGDKFEVNDKNQYLYVKGCSNVTIEGNAHVKVNGNKTEEITGDLTQLVHGNYMLSVGSEANINASEGVNMRANDIKVEALTGQMNLLAKEQLNIGAAEGQLSPYGVVQIYGEKIMMNALDKLHLKASTTVNIAATNELNMSASQISNKATLFDVYSSVSKQTATTSSHIRSPNTRIHGDTTVHVRGANVYIDDFISMANGDAGDATKSEINEYFEVQPTTDPFNNQSPLPEEAKLAQAPELPQPVTKSTSIAPSCKAAAFSVGILGGDDQE